MRLTCVILFALTSSAAFAQSGGLLGRLNDSIIDGQRVSLSKKVLTIEGFKDGLMVKTDRVNPFDLDPERMAFLEKEKIVMLPCRDDAEGCIERKRMPDGQRNHRERLNFEVRDPHHADELMTALRGFLSPYQK